MKVGIVTDSHDHCANIEKAVHVFTQQQVQCVFHSGDIVSPFSAKAFAPVAPARFIAVFGNNDGEKIGLKTALAGFGGEIHDHFFKGKIAGKRVFMTHTPGCIEEVARSQMADLVIYGHTHKTDVRRVESTLIVNPGEAGDCLTGQGKVALLDLQTMDYVLVPLT